MLTDETYTFYLFSWKKCCIGGSVFTIVYIKSPLTVGTILSEKKNLTTFWRGNPPDEAFTDLKLLAIWV